MNYKLQNRMKTINKYDYIIYPFLIVFGIGIILMYFPKGFIPDYFNIKNYTKTYELFNLIISSLVSLIGIYITVSLIAYEFFRQKSGIDFTKSFLVSRLNGYFISFTVFTILFTFISSIIVSFETPTDNEISLVYFISVLFMVVILSLFPIAFNLFSSLKPEKVADIELSKIDSQSILLKNSESIYKQAENDPLIKIENIVISLLTVKDVYKALSIIQKVTHKTYKIIIEEKNKNNRNYFIDRLISFYVKIIDSTITQPNNSSVLKSVWTNVEDIYYTTAITKEPIEKLNYFQSQFIRRYFNRLFQIKNEEIIYEGILTLKRIVINQVLNNIPSDDENPSLNTLKESIDKNFKYPNLDKPEPNRQ